MFLLIILCFFLISYMINMTKENIKHKAHLKKANPASKSELDAFLKNQQNIVTRLKSELKSVVNKVQLSDNGTVEKDKCILELQTR